MDAELQQYLSRIEELPLREQQEILSLLEKLEATSDMEVCRTDFLKFVTKMWPGFIYGRHHKIIADAFERVATGKLKRLCISIAPRMSKSELSSFLFPAWFLGRYPHKKVIQASNKAELAVGFGRKVRNLMASPDYQKIFSGITLASDSKAAGRWSTNKGGEYYAIGVGGAMTGRGADLCIIDDPHDEQQAALAQFKPELYDADYEWYTSGPRQRLQPGGAIIMIATRWSQRDLIGQVLKHAADKGLGDEWEVIELPAILPSGNALWPEYWPLEELLKVKADIPPFKWNAQYMQNPTAQEGAIIKREWWQTWTEEKPPGSIEFVIQTWDTAFSSKDKANFSACTTWGIFTREVQNGDLVQNQPNIILLDAYKARLAFPDLKKEALRLYRQWTPDAFIVEEKVTGVPLIYELRAMGIPVSGFLPTHGTRKLPNDKVARLNSVSDIFRSGLVWAPDRKWADQVIEEVCTFPAGSSDDLVDTTIMALLRYRQGGFIQLDTDELDDGDSLKHRRKVSYY